MRSVRFLSLLLVTAVLAKAEPHPRLLFPASAEAGVKQRIADDPLAARIQAQIVKRAESVLKERTCEYRIPDGKRLLSESRGALHHVLFCGWVWRTTGDERHRERVIRELDAASALKDWNPSHFLDTAEMATAVAIGYDWLYPSLTPEQRLRYEDAILRFALPEIETRHAKSKWWAGPDNNWSQVCGTGMALAAEAIRERDPARCEAIIRRGKELVESCRAFYEPDGAYPEGPAYWHYGTNYHVLLLAARESLGQPVDVPGLLHRSGDFMRHVTGPTRLSFNFADGDPYLETPTPAQSWIAARFKDPGQASHVRGLLERALQKGVGTASTNDLRFFPLHLLWLPEEPEKNRAASRVTPVAFKGQQAFAFFRTAWTPDAAWLAIKGGTGAASHGHLDAGVFVYEAGGIRWFHDMGKDNYNMPGYFGKQRWDYFRLTNLSHNTLVIGGKLQATPREGCPVVMADSGNQARIDLTTAYAGQADSVLRSAGFDPSNGAVTLTDRIVKPAGPVRWAVIAKVPPKIEGGRVILEEAGKRLVLTRKDKSGGAWETYSLKPPTDREKGNKGYHMFGFTAPAADALVLEVGWKPE
jgi:hypothetical protein